MKKIRPKPAGCDFVDRIFIGGGNCSYIDLDGFGGADPDDFLFLESPQELRLGGKRKFADFIKE